MNMGKVSRDLSSAFDKGMPMRTLKVHFRWQALWFVVQDQHWTALVSFAKNWHQFRPRALKRDVVHFHSLLEQRIKFQQAGYFGASRAKPRARAVV